MILNLLSKFLFDEFFSSYYFCSVLPSISESYTPETKKKINYYQKQFSQPGAIKPLNFNQLGGRRSNETSSSPKMRKLKDMQ